MTAAVQEWSTSYCYVAQKWTQKNEAKEERDLENHISLRGTGAMRPVTRPTTVQTQKNEAKEERDSENYIHLDGRRGHDCSSARLEHQF